MMVLIVSPDCSGVMFTPFTSVGITVNVCAIPFRLRYPMFAAELMVAMSLLETLVGVEVMPLPFDGSIRTMPLSWSKLPALPELLKASPDTVKL